MGTDNRAAADAMLSLQARKIRYQRCISLAYSLMMLRTAMQLDQGKPTTSTQGGAA
jgi:hypothetical protein